MLRAPADATTINPAARAAGRLRVPGDKSISHRYAIMAAIADGESRLTGFSSGADPASTLTCLQALGVSFDADSEGDVALGLEGGHSVRRVAHAGGSATGRRILRQLSAQAARHPRIEVLEGRRAAAPVMTPDARCAGLVLDDGRAEGRDRPRTRAVPRTCRARQTARLLGSGLLLARAAERPADLESTSFTDGHRRDAAARAS